MKKLRILVTGGSGFIGSHLIPQLKKQKHNIINWDLSEGADIFAADIETAISSCDVVIHLAALTSVNQSFKTPGKVFVTNVLGTARIVALCIKHKKKLIYPSSAAIYHRELSPYAESKALAEDLVKGVMKEIPVVILRLFNVFGPGMNPNSGSIMYNFLHDKKIVVYGDGEQTRDYVHVQDVVNIMEDAIKSKWNGKIVDVGTGESYTTNFVAGLFAYFRKLSMEYMPPRREIKWSIANTAMVKQLYKKKLVTDLGKNIPDLVIKIQGHISNNHT